MIRSFGAILRKEWLGLRPLFFLLVMLFIVGLLIVQFTEFMDEKSIWADLLSISNFALVITFIICAIGCRGVLTREQDEGTLQYLDGLPISRAAVYTAKWLVVFGMLATLDLIWTAESTIYELLSRESNFPAIPWSHIATFTVLNIFVTGFFVSLLMTASFMRLWTFLVLGMLYGILMYLKAKQVPYVELLDPFSLIQPPDSIDDPWVWPWRQIVVIAVMGVGLWLLGLYLFAKRSQGGSPAAKHRGFWARLGKVAAIFVTVVIFGIIFVVNLANSDEMAAYEASLPKTGDDIRPEPEGGNQVQQSQTEHFDFVYREKIAERLQPLIEESDAILAKVAATLEVSEELTRSRIAVDMMNPLGSHNAGQAYWNKIRMGYPEGQGHDEAVAILGHEVAHVLIDRASDGRLEQAFGSSRWFHEGLASYIEFHDFREPGADAEYEHWLALSSTWGEVQFRELVDDGLLSQLRDPNIVYAAGMEWVRAAVDVYGEGCPAELLRSLGREDAPTKLGGIELWRDTCLAADYDLERIRARFRARLRELRDRHAEVCEQMPEIKEGEAERRDGKIVITPELPDDWRKKAPKKAKLICRIRPDTDAPPYRWRYSPLREGNEFSVSALHFTKPKIQYQIGWQYKGWSAQPVYGQWISATLED